MLIRNLLRYMVREGSVHLIDSRGRRTRCGDGREPCCTLHFHSRRLEYKLPLDPLLLLSEGYMDGDITIEDGSLQDFLTIVLLNFRHMETHWAVKLGAPSRWLTQGLRRHNPIRRARRNVAHHYDLSEELYRLFLDRDQQYSCAYFTSPHDDLDQAQNDKKRHLAAKLLLDRPGLRLLDIGSGWGGLGLYLAETTGCDVTGVTLSVEQHKISRKRARRAGLGRRVRFLLEDYREEKGVYDRIVSVGMFEHVGAKNYDEFFCKVRDLLTDDGVCLLHSIGSFDVPKPGNSFMRKYIFPGGYVPSLSEVIPSIERSGLLITDLEVLRLHYAETLKLWHERFQANRQKVARLYDERFCRMWELYLKASEIGFRHHDAMVFQIQLAKNQEAVPPTRDYIYQWERTHPTAHKHAAE